MRHLFIASSCGGAVCSAVGCEGCVSSSSDGHGHRSAPVKEEEQVQRRPRSPISPPGAVHQWPQPSTLCSPPYLGAINRPLHRGAATSPPPRPCVRSSTLNRISLHRPPGGGAAFPPAAHYHLKLICLLCPSSLGLVCRLFFIFRRFLPLPPSVDSGRHSPTIQSGRPTTPRPPSAHLPARNLGPSISQRMRHQLTRNGSVS